MQTHRISGLPIIDPSRRVVGILTSRDLRFLIATDVAQGFPSLVARRPERFKMPAGKSKDDVVASLRARR